MSCRLEPEGRSAPRQDREHPRVLFGVVLVLALLSTAIPRAEATILVQMSVEELTRTSDLVVVGAVLEQWVQWDEAEQRVRTYTRVVIEEVLTPADAPEQPGTELVIEQEGGFLEDWGVMVPGNARLVEGERAVLFLLRGDFYYIQGMEQGKYSIVSEVGDVDRVHRPATVPVAVQAIRGTSLQLEHPIVPLNGRPLSDLTEAVRSAEEGRP